MLLLMLMQSRQRAYEPHHFSRPLHFLHFCRPLRFLQHGGVPASLALVLHRVNHILQWKQRHWEGS